MTNLNTPLFLGGDGWLVDANGQILAETYGHNPELAQEIVRRTNGYEALLNATKALLLVLNATEIYTEEDRRAIKTAEYELVLAGVVL